MSERDDVALSMVDAGMFSDIHEARREIAMAEFMAGRPASISPHEDTMTDTELREITMRTPTGGRSSIAVAKNKDGVSIKFSRSSDGEVMVMLPRYAAEQLVEQISSILGPAVAGDEGDETVTLTRSQMNAVLRAAFPFKTDEERASIMSRALPTRPEAVVRKLEWFVISVGRRAESLIGPYEVHFDEPRFYVAGPGGFSANVGSEQEAKAVAQTDYEARIMSALSLPVIEGDAEGWRPIDSAPKDVSKVDLWVHYHEGDQYKRVADARWDDEHQDWDFGPGMFRAGQYMFPVIPTHWMPLPSPPTSTDEGRPTDEKLRSGLQNVADSLSSRPPELRGPFPSAATTPEKSA